MQDISGEEQEWQFTGRCRRRDRRQPARCRAGPKAVPIFSRNRIKDLILAGSGRDQWANRRRAQRYKLGDRRRSHARCAPPPDRGRADPEDIPLDILLRGRPVDRHQQARGDGGPPCPRQLRAARWSTRCCYHCKATACPASTGSSARASCTGSTRIRPASWSRPRPSTAHGASRGAVRRPRPLRAAAPRLYRFRLGPHPDGPRHRRMRRSAGTRTTG